MLLEEIKVAGARSLQRDSCERFSSHAAEKIHTAESCRFSLVPHEELNRQAAGWYEACAEAMLCGNYAPIDQWVQDQSRFAADKQFQPEDLVEFLRLCRSSAFEVEGWTPDVFSPVDEIIHEALTTIRAKVLRETPGALNHQTRSTDQLEEATSKRNIGAEGQSVERRDCGRSHLQLPIRVRATGEHERQGTVTQTQNISRTGLLFFTSERYQVGDIVLVTFPYWGEFGGINREYRAKILRIDSLPDNGLAVAIRFLDGLDLKAKQERNSYRKPNISVSRGS
jgi:hypothetical protein